MDTLQKIANVRVKDTQDLATAEARAAKLTERQRQEKRHERNRLLWAQHFERLAETHQRLSEEQRSTKPGR